MGRYGRVRSGGGSVDSSRWQEIVGEDGLQELLESVGGIGCTGACTQMSSFCVGVELDESSAGTCRGRGRTCDAVGEVGVGLGSNPESSDRNRIRCHVSQDDGKRDLLIGTGP